MRAGKRGPEFGEKRRVHDRDLSLAFFQEVGIIACPQCGAGRHGHGSNFHGAEVCGREFRDVRDNDENPLLALDSETPQPAPNLVDLFRDFAVRQPPVAAYNRGMVVPVFPEVAVYEILGEIIVIRKFGHQKRRHPA